MVDSDSFPRTLDNEKLGEDDQEDIYRHKYTSDEDDEYIQVLIRRELTSPSSFMITSHWIVTARLDSIKWIFNVSFLIFFPSSLLLLLLFSDFLCIVMAPLLSQAMTLLGFQLRTAYLSVAYFDKFLSRRMIDVSNIYIHDVSDSFLSMGFALFVRIYDYGFFVCI